LKIFITNKSQMAFTKRPSAVLRCKPHLSTWIYIRLASEHFVKPTAFSGKEGDNL
jgi:hypothetical protein